MTESSAITFSGRNCEFGWMSPFSPYHTSFNIDNKVVRGPLYKLWSEIIYLNRDSDASRGYYSTINSAYNDKQKFDILIELLMNMTDTHDILKENLKSTGDCNVIYTVSKYSSNDMKWMGYNSEKNNGYNNLGKAWMYTRSSL